MVTISVNGADALLEQHVTPLPATSLPLSRAAGKVLREDIYADRDLPPFDRCMLDGYAVRAAETKPGAYFTVTSQLFAGKRGFPLPQTPYAAIEIMTGAKLPTGADAVIPYEQAELQADGRFIYTGSNALEEGAAIHKQASDYPRGTRLLKAGAILNPVQAGIAASCGYAELRCAQQPRIAVFGTGDELVPPDAIPEEHQIRQSNLYAIENALVCARFSVNLLDKLGDDRNEAMPRLSQALAEHDVVIISGAVSKGKKDWIPAALGQLSQCIFHGVAQRPGKPMGFWKQKGGAAIFGLPGNPVSTLVATYRYVLPYLYASTGAGYNNRRNVELAEPFAPLPNMTLFLPFSFDRNSRALPKPTNNSGDYARLADTDGFLELPQGTHPLKAGSPLPCTLWQK